jgi:hypothetical protein
MRRSFVPGFRLALASLLVGDRAAPGAQETLGVWPAPRKRVGRRPE